MKAVLFRAGSVPTQASLLSGSPRFSIPVRHDSLEVSNISRMGVSKTMSLPRSISRLKSISAGSQTFAGMLPEAEEEVEPLSYEDVAGGIGSLKFAEKCFDRLSWAVDESRFPCAGSGSGRDGDGIGTGRSSGGNNNNDYERNKIGTYYQQMLKTNPNDPLLLRNYGKFLHEVEGDGVKAEEYYGRAILASPGDGELLSLYGKLIWDTQRDGERAKSYFDQAASVSPDDCMVMGSYAQFLWEVEDDEDEENNVWVPAAQPQPQPVIAAL